MGGGEPTCRQAGVLELLKNTMSSWVHKVLDIAPELREEVEAPDASLYSVFRELVPLTVEAHLSNDRERLGKIYAFAAWCLEQPDEEIWNPAGVSFYEHLADHPETRFALVHWVSRRHYDEIRDLLRRRMKDDDFL